MPVLTLGYRHCDRKRPSYIKNSEIEGIAVLARQQLVDAAADAISLATLSAISGLKINGVVFDLFVGTWIARRAGELGLPHLAIVPVLALTFLFGPAGLLAFFVLRAALRPTSLHLQQGTHP